MVDIHVGGTLARLPHPRAAASLRFFEFAPKPPLPTLKTLARYAKELRSDLRCALVCPRSTWQTAQGALRKGPELDAGIDWIKRVSDILRVDGIVVATAAELSTGERDRSLLADFMERLRPTGRLLVVAPRGLWEAEHGALFARQTNTIYGFDALEDEIPEAEVVYARVRPMGARPRLTDGHLAQIAERVGVAAQASAYVAIESEQASRDAKRLTKLLGELQGELAGDADGQDDDEDDEDDPDAETESSSDG